LAQDRVGLRSVYWQGVAAGCAGGSAVAAAFGVYSLVQGELDTGAIMFGLAGAQLALAAILRFLWRRDDLANAHRLRDDARD
jgi:hypothetical protein